MRLSNQTGGIAQCPLGYCVEKVQLVVAITLIHDIVICLILDQSIQLPTLPTVPSLNVHVLLAVDYVC